MGTIHLGTCGYGYYDPPEGWKENYETKLQAFTEDFSLLEVQKSFYKLPRAETCRRWRENADEGFTFTLKGWQALTHPLNSPTWRGNADQLSEDQREKFGYLRPNESVKDAWNQTLERAEALKAPVVLLQCPGSFEPTDENEKNMRELLSTVDRGDVTIAWEPRGEWLKQPDRVAGLCRDLNLTHTVDPLRRDPFHTDSTVYLRLHGLNEDPYDYNYDYSREELARLRDKLRGLAEDTEDVYCLFNNFQKFENLRTLEGIL